MNEVRAADERTYTRQADRRRFYAGRPPPPPHHTFLAIIKSEQNPKTTGQLYENGTAVDYAVLGNAESSRIETREPVVFYSIFEDAGTLGSH